ncbi:MAG: hypothetical protein O7F73_16150, partial [Gammaproteobacteria bacterium]|nr:hypothetical protein [Gammaproteobacteria bacterium]
MERIQREAHRHNLVIWEAFAFRHHPFWQRVLELLRKLGEIRQIDSSYCMPIHHQSWNVYNYDHAGGAIMDTCCYAVQMARHIAEHANNARAVDDKTGHTRERAGAGGPRYYHYRRAGT